MNLNFKSLTTKFLAVGLSLTIAMSVGASVMPQTAHASVSDYQRGKNIITTANWYLGVRYKFGARTNIEYEFDCSSFTKYVFGRNYIYLPRTSQQQSKMGSYVSRKNLRKGDLVFFSTSGSHGKVAHVGIYSQNGWMVNTYGSGGVKYTNINSAWWSSHYITARRVF